MRGITRFAGLAVLTAASYLVGGFISDENKVRSQHSIENKQRIKFDFGAENLYFSDFFDVVLPTFRVDEVDSIALGEGMCAYVEDAHNFVIGIDTNYHFAFEKRKDMALMSQYFSPNLSFADAYRHELTHLVDFSIRFDLLTSDSLVMDSPYILGEAIANWAAYRSSSIVDVPYQGFTLEDVAESSSPYVALHYIHAMQLVTPVLDELGLEKGIRKMYSSAPPSKEEMSSPELYSQRILGLD